jgi:hypothetical protein
MLLILLRDLLRLRERQHKEVRFHRETLCAVLRELPRTGASVSTCSCTWTYTCTCVRVSM